MKTNLLFVDEVQIDFPKPGDRFPISAFTPVAEIDVPSGPDPQDAVWMVAQNIDSRWVDDSRVTLTAEGTNLRQRNLEMYRARYPASIVSLADIGIRSMMVGDIVTHDGGMLMCGAIGWLPVQQEEAEYVLGDPDLPCPA